MNTDIIELLIWAAIACFVLYRLFLVIGQKTGFKGSKDHPLFRNAKKEKPTPSVDDEDSPVDSIPEAYQQTLKKIRGINPDFKIKEFLNGAEKAFEMIIKAYAKDDLETLKNLLDDDIFKEFAHEIEERQKQGETLETTLVKLEELRLDNVVLKKQVAEITVKYVSEQIHLLKDANGTILEGNLNQVEQMTDRWTFRRDLSSKDPNWTLIKATH
jgi:predicted lipid-binding transport protein (Tim44 family)